MGWIARSSARLGGVATPAGSASSRPRRASSTTCASEIRKMRDLTDKPFGVNIAQLFVRDPGIVDFVVAQGVPLRHHLGRRSAQVHRAAQGGRSHGLPRRAVARRGVEGDRRPASTGWWSRAARAAASRTRATSRPWCCCRWCCSKVDVPVIARRRHLRRAEHGGRVRARRRGRADGLAHGVGGRVAGARELEAARSSPPPRPTPSSSTASAAPACGRSAPQNDERARTPGARRLRRLRARAMDLYFGGDMEAAIAPRRPGGRPHRRGEAGGADHRRNRRGLFRATAAAMQRLARRRLEHGAPRRRRTGRSWASRRFSRWRSSAATT